MNLSASAGLSWQQLRPELSLALNIDKLTTNPVHFFDLQPRARSAIDQFLQNPQRHLLLLKADEQSEYASLLQDYIQQQQAPLRLCGVQYEIQQADSFSFAQVNVQPATRIEDNFAAKKTVAQALYTDKSQLFGSVQIHPISKDLQLNAGLVHQLNGGVLILSLSNLLTQFDCWQRLKQILTSKTFQWYSSHPYNPLPCEIPAYSLELKVILLATRQELATFSELETDLFAFADYAEIESYFYLESEAQQQQWANYVVTFAQQQQFPVPTQAELQQLYQVLVRESEDRYLINISQLQLANLFNKASLLMPAQQKRAGDFFRVFQQTQYQQGFLREQTYAGILHEQIYIPTEGEAIGQINGLSVIEYPGTPISFGEPTRISCIVQFGDGEIIDVERKNELAGNIHSKGMMIAERCLANILSLPSQLPFSASLVFEQSYGDIDGDSASLAAFCALTSALADVPIPQHIAVTGTIDQFGLVHTVGGVNDKIEGFFSICEKRGLTGKQGVIIPSVTLQQLSLSEDVVNAVKAEKFFIWAVEEVYQACEILFQRDLIEDESKKYNEENLPISYLINQRIELRQERESKWPLWRWLGGLLEKKE